MPAEPASWHGRLTYQLTCATLAFYTAECMSNILYVHLASSFPGRKMLTAAAAAAARTLLGAQKTQSAQHGYGYGYGRGHYGGGYYRPGAYHGQRPSYGRPYYGRYHG